MPDTSERNRQRTINPEVVANRGALEVVRPINRQVGIWQSAVVRLSMLAARDGAGNCPSKLVREAEELLAAVELEREKLEDARDSADSAVAHNSRMVDTMRALERLLTTISDVLQKMQPPARA